MCGNMLGMRPSAWQLSLVPINPLMTTSPAIDHDSTQGACKSFSMNYITRGSSSHLTVEPTSVLDLRSPSPTSSTPSPGFQALERGGVPESTLSPSVMWHTPKRSNLGPASSQDEVRTHFRDQLNQTVENAGAWTQVGQRVGNILTTKETCQQSEAFWEQGADGRNWHSLCESGEIMGSVEESGKKIFFSSGGTGRPFLEGQQIETSRFRIFEDGLNLGDATADESTQRNHLDVPDFQNISMEVDNPASAFAVDELESMFLMSSSTAPDCLLMKWLLGDTQQVPSTKVSRGSLGDEAIGFESEDSWSSNLQQDSNVQAQASKVCVTQGLFSKTEIPSCLNTSYNHSSGALAGISEPMVNPLPRFSLAGDSPHPALARVSLLRSFATPSSVPSPASSMPRLPSETTCQPELELSHSPLPLSFLAPTETEYGSLQSVPSPSFTSFLSSRVSEPSVCATTPSPLEHGYFLQSTMPDNTVTKSPRSVPSAHHWQSQQTYHNSVPRLQAPGINISSFQHKSFTIDSPTSSMQVDCKNVGRQRDKPVNYQQWAGEYVIPPSIMETSPCGAPLLQKGFEHPSPPKRMTPTPPSSSPPTPSSYWRGRNEKSVTSTSSASQISSLEQVKGGVDSGGMAIDLLLTAAEEVDRGNMENAQGILVRLNRLVSPRGGNSLHRVSFYFMEALVARISPQSLSFSKEVPESPLDTYHKVSAHKKFCEISPLPQFAYFTSNQAILEAMQEEELIHIIDFEGGQGVQWASFLQDIAAQAGGKPRNLRLTVVGNHSNEVHLTGRSLCQFAKTLELSLDFQMIEATPESLTLSMLELREGEAIAVNFVLSLHRLLLENSSQSFNSVLSLVREIRPKVVTVVELEANLNLPLFHQRFAEALQYYTFLFDSLNGNIEQGEHSYSSGEISVIERFLLAPEIVNIVSCEGNERVRRHEKLQLWRTRLRASGLHGLPLSDRNIMQAENLLSSSKLWSGGYEIVKDEGSFFLSWQGRPLMAASAWGC